MEAQKYLKDGIELFMAHLSSLLAASLAFNVVMMAASIFPLAALVVAGPMAGGMFYILSDLKQGKDFDIKRLFDGFRLKLVPLILGGLLVSIFSSLASILLLLPGLLVLGWYSFTFLLIIHKGLDFWPAMEASRKIGFEDHIRSFILGSCGFLVVIGGAIMGYLMIMVLGLPMFMEYLFIFLLALVAAPYYFCVVFCAYPILFGKGK